MGSIKITGLNSAKSVLSSQRGKPPINKRLELGKEYVLLFPKHEGEIVVSGIPGYTCSFEDIGISFVRLTNNQMDVDEETNRIIDRSGIRSWANISDILYSAARARDIEKATDEAKKMAERTGVSFESQSAALTQTIEKINQAYDGVRATSTTSAVPPTKTRLVSRGLTISIFTNVLLIPLNEHLMPEYDKACAVEVRLSQTKINQLSSIQSSPAYNDPNDPEGFVEVKFSYKGTTRNEAGRQSYQGCEEAVRKINLKKNEDGSYVDKNVNSIASIIASISHDPDVIYNSSNTVAYASLASDLDAAMRKYLATERTIPTYIDMEADNVKRSARELLDAGVFGKNTKQYAQLEEMLQAEESENSVSIDTANSLPSEVADVVKSNTVTEVDNIVKNSDELAEMLAEEITDI